MYVVCLLFYAIGEIFFVFIFFFLHLLRLGEGRWFHFAFSWRWMLPMLSSSHIEMLDLMPLQHVVFGGR